VSGRPGGERLDGRGCAAPAVALRPERRWGQQGPASPPCVPISPPLPPRAGHLNVPPDRVKQELDRALLIKLLRCGDGGRGPAALHGAWRAGTHSWPLAGGSQAKG
jgi:hypothetical protein